MKNSLEYLEEFKEGTKWYYSPRTLAYYYPYTKRFLENCNKPLSEIKKNDILHWLVRLKNTGIAKGTSRNHLASIKAFFEYCFCNDIIDVDPAVDVEDVEVDDVLPDYLSKGEILRIQEEAKDNLRDRLIIDVLYDSGVRVDELKNIRKDDIDGKELRINIREGKGLKQRYVPITPKTYYKIEEYIKSRNDNSDFLFINKYNQPFRKTDSINNIIKKYVNKARVKKNVTSRWFRNSMLTHLHENGATLWYLGTVAGHFHEKTTKRYIKSNKDRLSAVHKKTFR